MAKQKKPTISLRDSDSDSENYIDISQAALQDTAVPSGLLKQFEKMLHKALKHTSEQITSNLTKEIIELRHRTETLEFKVEEIEVFTQECLTELDSLKEESMALIRLEGHRMGRS